MLSKSVYEWHINQHAMSTCFYGICIITTIDATSTTSFDSLISEKYEISQGLQGIPAFRDFTIRDPRYFLILFQAKFHDLEEKNPKKQKKLDFFF